MNLINVKLIKILSDSFQIGVYIKPNNNSSDPNAEFAVRARNSTCSRMFQNWRNKQQSLVKDKWVLVHKPSDLTLATDELSCDKNAGAWVSLVSLYLKDWMQKGFIMVKDDDVVIIRRIVSSFLLKLEAYRTFIYYVMIFT